MFRLYANGGTLTIKNEGTLSTFLKLGTPTTLQVHSTL